MNNILSMKVNVLHGIAIIHEMYIIQMLTKCVTARCGIAGISRISALQM